MSNIPNFEMSIYFFDICSFKHNELKFTKLGHLISRDRLRNGTRTVLFLSLFSQLHTSFVLVPTNSYPN